MKQFDVSQDFCEDSRQTVKQQTQNNLEYAREVLKHITNIGSSLRIQMDTQALLKHVSVSVCEALRFRYSALYISDDTGYFRFQASSGINDEQEAYLRERPLPADVVAELINETYRISESYFIPAEAPLWQNEYVTSFFMVVEENVPPRPLSGSSFPPSHRWNPNDLLVVPLTNADNTLLGFLTPDSPLDDLRPTLETMALLELFVNQAAVVIEGTRMYEEARRSSEERAALIEVGEALSSPDALHDLQTVYRAIYEQVRRVMPTDAFLISRYASATDKMFMDYLIDEGIEYPAEEYIIMRPRTRDFLYHAEVGRIFSTAQEYTAFANDDSTGVEETIGNGHPSQSLLFVPVRYAGEPIGMLSTHSYTPHAYTQRHLEMLKEIGVQAGIAITNARLNTELREALQQAQESDRLKNHFLMTASHELRTPLTSIQGYLELLNSFGSMLDEETKSRFINNARRACEELVLLLGNVMDTSRVDQDKVSLNLGPVQVLKAVQMILEILEPTITREERDVEIDITDDLYVWVDDLRLRQILLNIVGNALKYTPPSTNITLSAASINYTDVNKRIAAANCQGIEPGTDQFVLITIRDWGAGISFKDQAHLFTKFMRLEKAINSIQRGAGLGLYLCRQLTEAMDGRIWVESQGIPGQGSSFMIALPHHRH
ncbi:MAG TPA: GAF domain-containing sensor histidine kinase [Ktedonobacteraceae bacterium]|nr:GAF domain-containing sensor histidine kinase [Ktedonobacteraceae bacterium]